jgi:hypothetical protein
MATWSDVSRSLKTLPAVVQTTGRREWKVKDKLLAWERPLRPSDRAALGDAAPSGPILAVYVPLDVKEMLLAARPKVYFTTPHFDGWPAILIRLPAIRANELRAVLHQAWIGRAPKKLGAELSPRRRPRPAPRGRDRKAGSEVSR